MQVNTNNIQRPTLIEPFLNEELTSDNEYMTYIDCNTNSSNIVHKNSSVTSDSHNSKKTLSDEYHRCVDNCLRDFSCFLVPSSMSSSHIFIHSDNSIIIFIKPDSDVINNLKKDDDFSIFETPQLHNCIQSLV